MFVDRILLNEQVCQYVGRRQISALKKPGVEEIKHVPKHMVDSGRATKDLRTAEGNILTWNRVLNPGTWVPKLDLGKGTGIP